MRKFGSDHTGVGRSIVYGESTQGRILSGCGLKTAVATLAPLDGRLFITWNSYTPFKSPSHIFPLGVKQKDGQELSNDLDAQVTCPPSLPHRKGRIPLLSSRRNKTTAVRAHLPM